MNIKKYLPEIFTGVAIGTHVLSNILFVRAAKNEGNKGKKVYILPAIVSCSSIASILLSDHFSSKEKATLIALLAASNAGSYVLEHKARDEYGDEKVNEFYKKVDLDDLNSLELDNIMNEADTLEENGAATEYSKQLYYFPQLHMIFATSSDTLSMAFEDVNSIFAREGEASVNDFLGSIDSSLIDEDEGDNFTWAINSSDPESGITRIDYYQYTVKLESGLLVTIVRFVMPPLRDEEWEEYYEKLEESYYERTESKYQEKV